jgi:hypothetical protein
MYGEKTGTRHFGGVRRPVGCHRSDLDLDFGTRSVQEIDTLTDRWRFHNLEEEHGIRIDALRAAGLIG